MIRSHRKMVLLTAMLAVIVLTSGCLGLGGDNPPADAVSPTNADARESNSSQEAPQVLERGFSGLIYYRSGVHGEPVEEAMWEGDPPGFCVVTPHDTRNVHANLTWTPPQDVGFQMAGPNGSRIDSWSDGPAGINPVPPINMTLEDPDPGAAYAYVGPGAVGGAIEWSLTLTYVVDRASATTDETEYTGEPCGL